MPSQLGQALSQHICDRLDDLIEAAEECVDYFRAISGDEKWDLEGILRLAQLDLEQYAQLPTPDQVRTLDVPVRSNHITEWRTAGEEIKLDADDLAAFAAFVDPG